MITLYFSDLNSLKGFDVCTAHKCPLHSYQLGKTRAEQLWLSR